VSPTLTSILGGGHWPPIRIPVLSRVPEGKTPGMGPHPTSHVFSTVAARLLGRIFPSAVRRKRQERRAMVARSRVAQDRCALATLSNKQASCYVHIYTRARAPCLSWKGKPTTWLMRASELPMSLFATSVQACVRCCPVSAPTATQVWTVLS